MGKEQVSDDVARRFNVFESSRIKIDMTIVMVNELLEQSGNPSRVSWSYREHEPTEMTPEELWLTLQLKTASPPTPSAASSLIADVMAALDAYQQATVKRPTSDLPSAENR